MATGNCPKCHSQDTVWRGYRRNKSVDKHMKLCKKCGHKFTPDDGYLRMRFKPGIIRRAMDLRKKGYSSAEVKENLQRYEGAKVSRWTVIKWERRYLKGMKHASGAKKSKKARNASTPKAKAKARAKKR